ncbi:acyl carrier protein [Paenibacillus sp. GbtcB18]|uniref:acyl carrier protein n=1 Tax=Paenibacillus sp. GbtcB18 TaxID=2824763 RepID=UPI001C30F2C3|nr:acyl carrier protein [Paenibacillus sp. GbtcB18]
MDRDTISSILKKIIAENVELEQPIDDVKPEENLFAIGMDSMDCVKLIVAIESEFQMEFSTDDIVDHFQSIQSITNYVEAKIA